MPALDRDTMQRWREMVVVDRNGTTVGTISEFYIDRGSRLPTFALLNTGLFGTKQTFVPLIRASERNGEIHLPYDKGQIISAPRVDIDGELTPDAEAALFGHYGMDYWHDSPGEPPPAAADQGKATTSTAAPDTVETIRSEEELQGRPVPREATRVRLEKYVVTEQVTQTVPLRREEVRVVREPVHDAPANPQTTSRSDQAQGPSVVLHEEQPVIDKRIVPKERVRLAKETVTEQREVADQVRKEQVRTDEVGRQEEDPS
jgi:uncharacterized protein (TIGR02271 family)